MSRRKEQFYLNLNFSNIYVSALSYILDFVTNNKFFYVIFFLTHTFLDYWLVST